MNKLLISLFLIGAFFIQLPAVSAWNFDTHKQIVETDYYSLSPEVQQNLDLNTMKEGSLAPDFNFFDFKYHSYPNSYDKSIYWLNRGQKYYIVGDYNDASYCYGVASHYISDSIAAPHAAGIKGTEHTRYEMEASFLTPQLVPSKGDLKSSLESGCSDGEKSWNKWIISRSDDDIQNNLNEATGASYNAIDSSISSSYFVDNKQKNQESVDKSGILMLLLNLI